MLKKKKIYDNVWNYSAYSWSDFPVEAFQDFLFNYIAFCFGNL